MREAFVMLPATPVKDVMVRWSGLVKGFDTVVGYTLLGDFILRNSATGQFAMLFTIDPELVPLDFFSLDEFDRGYLRQEVPKELVLKVDLVDRLRTRLGEPNTMEIFIPEPFPFLGGDGSEESYVKGNVFVYADLVGGLQGLE